ncbi:MAG: hypothetical protein KDB22_28965 [Planctomycetales bacterium]|nr:hypothetical protein [Planctomycetales bacterium]
MESPRSIPDLLDAAQSPDLAVAGHACRELLNRPVDCQSHIDRLIDLLQNSNAAITDYAFRTLERIGQPAVDPLIATYVKSQGDFRRLLVGLIAGISRFDDYFPILKTEINDGETECRYWAANCLGRNYNDDVDWPPDAMKLLDDAVEILVSLKTAL